MFSWKNEKNISKCRLLKIVRRVLSVKVCTNNSRMSLCMAKPTIRLVRRDGSACTLWDCTSADLSSLIRAFANRKYPLWLLGVTKRLVRRAKIRVSTRLHILIRAFADRICHRQPGCPKRNKQCNCNSTFYSDPSLIVHYARSLLYLVGRCTGWPEFAGRTYIVVL